MKKIFNIWTLLVLPLATLVVYLYIKYPIDTLYVNRDKVWCEENGGHYFDSYRNIHCEFAPDKK